MPKPAADCGPSAPEALAKHEGFEGLYARHHAGVFAVALGIVGSRQDAEEVAHDVLLKAQAHLDRQGLQVSAASPRWMRTVARRHALDVRKHRVRAEMRDVRYATDCGPNVGPNGRIDTFVDARRVTAELRSRFPDDVELVAKCMVECRDRADLARELGLTQNALSVRLHRAVQRLRRALGDHET